MMHYLQRIPELKFYPTKRKIIELGLELSSGLRPGTSPFTSLISGGKKIEKLKTKGKLMGN